MRNKDVFFVLGLVFFLSPILSWSQTSVMLHEGESVIVKGGEVEVSCIPKKANRLEDLKNCVCKAKWLFVNQGGAVAEYTVSDKTSGQVLHHRELRYNDDLKKLCPVQCDLILE